MSLRKLAIYSTIASGIIFLVGTTTAIFSYPGYDFFHQFFSELGMREKITGYNKAIYPELFNGTLMVSGILMLPFFPISIKVLRNKNKLSTMFFTLSAFFGTLTGPLLFLIGIFDLSLNWDYHVIFAINLYIVIIITSVMWLFALLHMDETFFYKKLSSLKFDYVVMSIIIISSFINSVGFIPELPVLRKFTVEAFQKILAYGYLGYFAVVAYRLRDKIGDKLHLHSNKNSEMIDTNY